jgi:hypothetical protein
MRLTSSMDSKRRGRSADTYAAAASGSSTSKPEKEVSSAKEPTGEGGVGLKRE